MGRKFNENDYDFKPEKDGFSIFALGPNDSRALIGQRIIEDEQTTSGDFSTASTAHKIRMQSVIKDNRPDGANSLIFQNGEADGVPVYSTTTGIKRLLSEEDINVPTIHTPKNVEEPEAEEINQRPISGERKGNVILRRKSEQAQEQAPEVL